MSSALNAPLMMKRPRRGAPADELPDSDSFAAPARAEDSELKVSRALRRLQAALAVAAAVIVALLVVVLVLALRLSAAASAAAACAPCGSSSSSTAGAAVGSTSPSWSSAPASLSSSSSGAPSLQPTVHVVSSCHLDVGFANLSAAVLNEYFDLYIPRAINVTAASRSAQLPYSWMTHGFVLSLFFDCPPGMGLHCPSPEAQAAARAAIGRGDITFHAFPFNSEFELYSSDLFEFGIALTHRLADELSPPSGRPRVISQRDVPGTTRAIVPLLKRAGVKGISIGQDSSAPPLRPYGGSAPLRSNGIYLWRDADSGTSTYLLVHGGGYGGIRRSDDVTIDGFDQVLVMDWGSDNSGPLPSVEAVRSHVAAIQAQYPTHRVIASTFNAFIELVDAAYTAGSIALPESDEECGDTWIYGASADPLKVGQFMQLQQLRSACLSEPECDSSSAAFFNFSRLLLKAGEHTWGGDVPTFLNAADSQSDYYAWSNAQFAAQRSNASSLFPALQQTFLEQRDWSVNFPLQALPADHPIRRSADALFKSLSPPAPPSLADYTDAGDSRQFSVGNVTLTVGASGELASLVDLSSSAVWADAGHRLSLLQYQQFNEASFLRFLQAYANCDIQAECAWTLLDYGKAGLDQAVSITERTLQPAVSALYSRQRDSQRLSLLVNLTFVNHSYYVTELGAPQQLWLQYELDASQRPLSLSVSVSWFNKTATRTPEAWWLSFSSLSDQPPRINKLGSLIDPQRVMYNGSRHLHGSIHPLEDERQVITPFSTPLLCLGAQPTPFPTPLPQDDTLTPGVSYSLYNNIWGTVSSRQPDRSQHTARCPPARSPLITGCRPLLSAAVSELPHQLSHRGVGRQHGLPLPPHSQALTLVARAMSPARPARLSDGLQQPLGRADRTG